MKNILLLINVIFFFTCKSSHSQNPINPEARALNDSAVKLDFTYPKTDGKPIEITANNIKSGPTYNMDSLYKRKIDLLDQAIQLDSNYFTAYWNKFVFQNGLKQYDKSVLTGKQLIKLEPNNAIIQYCVGEAYENMGDLIIAAQYYERSLITSDGLLKTINLNSKKYKSVQLNRATTLILLHKTDQGNEIIKELYTTEENPGTKELYRLMLSMTREELIHGKTTVN